MVKLTAKGLREALDYDPTTGVFTWATSRQGIKIGDIAGAVCAVGKDKRPYRYIGLDLRKYKASRLAWLYVTGEWPAHLIDHKDGDTLNDVFDNLRDVPPVGNSQNLKRHVDNASGFIGVSWHVPRQKWRARIAIDGRNTHLGLFDNPEAAHNAYMAAKAKHHEFQPVSREILEVYA